jgi:hypothetical protein
VGRAASLFGVRRLAGRRPRPLCIWQGVAGPLGIAGPEAELAAALPPASPTNKDDAGPPAPGPRQPETPAAGAAPITLLAAGDVAAAPAPAAPEAAAPQPAPLGPATPAALPAAAAAGPSTAPKTTQLLAGVIQQLGGLPLAVAILEMDRIIDLPDGAERLTEVLDRSCSVCNQTVTALTIFEVGGPCEAGIASSRRLRAREPRAGRQELRLPRQHHKPIRAFRATQVVSQSGGCSYYCHGHKGEAAAAASACGGTLAEFRAVRTCEAKAARSQKVDEAVWGRLPAQKGGGG